MLHQTNIIAMIGGGDHPRFPKNKVIIWDDYQVQCIAELVFQTPVHSVRLRRDRIVVVLERKTYVYEFSDLKLLEQIETYPNPSGLCGVSSDGDFVLACLGEKIGEVHVDHHFLNRSFSIPAHTTPISQLVLNQSGTKLATASAKGTIVRVFDTTTEKRIAEYRRGSQEAVINSISFNKESTMLCVASSTGTIHIYSCDEKLENKTSAFSMLRGWVPMAGDVWSAKQIYISESNAIASFWGREGNKHIIIVLSSSGKYSKYSFTDSSSECTLECMERFVS